jgi:hypothetical protein
LKAKTSWTAYLEDFLLTGRIEGKKAKALQWHKEILAPFVCYFSDAPCSGEVSTLL